MHAERFSISAAAAAAIGGAGRVVAVGTTVARTLESCATWRRGRHDGHFIRPPHTFRHVDVMLTNFHLAALDAADVGERVCLARVDLEGVCRGRARAVPLFQLRRLHATAVTVSATGDVFY